MNCINRFFSDTKYAISWGILGLFIVSILLSVFLVFQTIDVLDGEMVNSITLTGEGEIFAIPDIATFSVSARKIADGVSEAQSDINKRMNDTIDFLKKSGIEEKDIKTIAYNAYPKYEWVQLECFAKPCPPGKSEMTGYEVSQTISIKVRDTEKVGEVLDGIGALELDNISSLSFTVDDSDSLQRQARDMAIKDAKEQAEVLAKELGVKIKDIISFSESNSPRGGYGMMEMESVSMSKMDAALPVGESKITSQVYIVFEID